MQLERTHVAAAQGAVFGELAAAALAGIDVRYASTRRIKRIYLADAVLEAVFVTGWLLTARRRTPVDDVESRSAPIGS